MVSNRLFLIFFREMTRGHLEMIVFKYLLLKLKMILILKLQMLFLIKMLFLMI